jgi:hypothetical protein
VRRWRALLGEEVELYSPIGLRLLDEITGAAPIGWTRAELDVQDGAAWRTTDIESARSGSGIVAYPGLGRQREVAAQPPRHYRVRISAEFYRPLYRATTDAIEFDAYPYNDANAPADVVPAPQPMDVTLAPAANYPFGSNVPVLRGIVTDQVTGAPVRDVEVMVRNLELVLTDDDGLFALPMRFTPPNVPTPIDAMDLRSGRVGNITVTLPAALHQSQTIAVL